jgi:hypothetical protein
MVNTFKLTYYSLIGPKGPSRCLRTQQRKGGDFMERGIMSGALALVLVSVASAQTTVNKPRGVGQQSLTNESGNGNSVEGTLTVNGEAFKMTHAYARRVEGAMDKSKQDVLIVFADRAVARQVFEGSSQLHFGFGEKAKNDGLHGLELRISDRDERSEDGKVVQKITISVQIYHPSLSSFGFDLGGFLTNVETVSVTKDVAQGKVLHKSDYKFKDFKYEVSFKVSLRPEEWSGIIYKQPPTNLAPGSARGQLLIDGKPIKLNHAYAVQQSAAGDLWGDEAMNVRLFFTEKPLTDPEAALAEKNRDKFQHVKQAGNNYVMYLDVASQTSSSDPSIRELEKPGEDSSALVVAETNFLLAKFDDKNVDGRIFNDGALIKSDRATALDVSFNAAIIKSYPVDGPVTAANGQPLPAGGGAAGGAYLAFLEAVSATKNFKELKQLLEASQSAKWSAELKRSLETVPAEREQETFQVYKGVLATKNAQVEGGFVSGEKATLWVTGTDDGEKIAARINMHLENGQWKVGTGSKRVRE